MRLIDADALRDALGITGDADSCKGCKYNERYGFACNTDAAPTLEYVCEMIDDAPTIEERKTGRWIFKEDFRIVDGYDWKCDQCGSWQRYTSNFCPSCGCKMEG